MLEFFALAKNNENFYPNKNFHGLILSIVVQTILKKIKTKCPSIFFNFIAVNFSSQRKINSAPSKRSVTGQGEFYYKFSVQQIYNKRGRSFPYLFVQNQYGKRESPVIRLASSVRITLSY